MQRVIRRLPQGLQGFISSRHEHSDPPHNDKKEKDWIYRKLKTFERWHRLQSEVGWIAIAFSHAFHCDVIYRYGDKQFEDALRVLLFLTIGFLKSRVVLGQPAGPTEGLTVEHGTGGRDDTGTRRQHGDHHVAEPGGSACQPVTHGPSAARHAGRARLGMRARSLMAILMLACSIPHRSPAADRLKAGDPDGLRADS